MSFWIELHCDGAAETERATAAAQAEGKVLLHSICPSKRGDLLGDMAYNAGMIQRIVRMQGQRARQRGWLRTREGQWYCPACKDFRNGVKP